MSRLGARPAPIRRKLVLLMMLTTATCMFIAGPAWIAYSWQSTKARVVRDLETTSRVIAENTTATLSFRDVAAATEVLSALAAKPEVIGACLYELNAGVLKPFARYLDTEAACADTAPAEGTSQLRAEVPVMLADDRIGALRVVETLDPLYHDLRGQIVVAIFVIAGSLALSLVLALRMQGVITAPILRLTEAAQRVSDTKDYSLRVPEGDDDELGRLSADFNTMLAQIAKSDEEVRRTRAALAVEVERKSEANAGLERALENLRLTQKQLVQSEKMASLGALVAGIAHEINTPVGVGVTAASTLQARAELVDRKYRSNDLTRADLEAFLAIATESGELILSNLIRAADLIQGFKRVAVDQSSNERREFALKPYINEVLLSLGPKFKHTGHQVRVNCPEGLTLDNYPGVLAQILTNFISNSLIHAFDEGKAGHIDIDVRAIADDVELRCSDDGHGTTPENLARIFDPFFTTRRGSGGTGLGLHIVYNLVTQTLGGTVSAVSAVGRGLAITLRFPRIAPEYLP